MDIYKCPKMKYGFENQRKKNTKSGLDHNGLNEITTKIICDDKLFLYFYNILKKWFRDKNIVPI